MSASVETLRKEFHLALEGANTPQGLEEVRIQYLGRKQGAITALLSTIKSVPAGQKKEFGQQCNALRQDAEASLENKLAQLQSASAETPGPHLDLTLPGRRRFLGKPHPLSLVREELEDIFIAMGFSIRTGPEIESDFHNFEALNMPPDHPARDMQDTFFIDSGNDDDYVLRTHTSPVQIRTMLKEKPPIYVIAPGKVYRRDYDISHTPMFMQIEGLVVAEDITFSHLKGTLELFARRFFGEDAGLRFRPSFFPFTEPSAEVDVRCILCHGKGCRLCSDTGWIEILGSGMVDPNVLRNVNIDPEIYTGFAFGLGIDRMAVLKYGIDDARQFYENDLRFLEQFPDGV